MNASEDDRSSVICIKDFQSDDIAKQLFLKILMLYGLLVTQIKILH